MNKSIHIERIISIISSQAPINKMTISRILRDRLSAIYLLFVFSLMLHVADEAANNFLGFYNPLIMRIRERISFFPFPVFSFNLWIAGLSLLIIILILFTLLIYKRNRIIIFIIKIFSLLMILNGLGHIIGSIYYSRILPGFYSSPFLIGFSIYLLVITRKEIKS